MTTFLVNYDSIVTIYNRRAFKGLATEGTCQGVGARQPIAVSKANVTSKT